MISLHFSKKAAKINDFSGFLVRVVRLERTVSWSQTRRDTNFAIPGYLILPVAYYVSKTIFYFSMFWIQ